MASTVTRPVFNSLNNIFRINKAFHVKRSTEAIRKLRPSGSDLDSFTTHANGSMNSAGDEAESATQTPGERVLMDFEEMMENGFRYKSKPLRRSTFQRDFTDICVRALARNIVGADWSKCGQRVMQKHGWSDTKRFAAATGPRRFGKSMLLAVLLVCYALFVPKSTQCVFSTGGRASSNDLELITMFLREMGLSHWIWRKGKESIFLRPNPARDDDIRKIFCYPSNEKISRCEACGVRRYAPSMFMANDRAWHGARRVRIPLMDVTLHSTTKSHPHRRYDNTIKTRLHR